MPATEDLFDLENTKTVATLTQLQELQTEKPHKTAVERAHGKTVKHTNT